MVLWGRCGPAQSSGRHSVCSRDQERPRLVENSRLTLTGWKSASFSDQAPLWLLYSARTCVIPVGRLVGATAEVDGELSNMCVRARQHREQLHEIHGPHMTVSASVGPLLQAELCDRCLQLRWQRDGYDRRSLRKRMEKIRTEQHKIRIKFLILHFTE